MVADDWPRLRPLANKQTCLARSTEHLKDPQMDRRTKNTLGKPGNKAQKEKPTTTRQKTKNKPRRAACMPGVLRRGFLQAERLRAARGEAAARCMFQSDSEQRWSSCIVQLGTLG